MESRAILLGAKPESESSCAKHVVGERSPV